MQNKFTASLPRTSLDHTRRSSIKLESTRNQPRQRATIQSPVTQTAASQHLPTIQPLRNNRINTLVGCKITSNNPIIRIPQPVSRKIHRSNTSIQIALRRNRSNPVNKSFASVPINNTNLIINRNSRIKHARNRPGTRSKPRMNPDNFSHQLHFLRRLKRRRSPNSGPFNTPQRRNPRRHKSISHRRLIACKRNPRRITRIRTLRPHNNLRPVILPIQRRRIRKHINSLVYNRDKRLSPHSIRINSSRNPIVIVSYIDRNTIIIKIACPPHVRRIETKLSFLINIGNITDNFGQLVNNIPQSFHVPLIATNSILQNNASGLDSTINRWIFGYRQIGVKQSEPAPTNNVLHNRRSLTVEIAFMPLQTGPASIRRLPPKLCIVTQHVTGSSQNPKPCTVRITGNRPNKCPKERRININIVNNNIVLIGRRKILINISSALPSSVTERSYTPRTESNPIPVTRNSSLNSVSELACIQSKLASNPLIINTIHKLTVMNRSKTKHFTRTISYPTTIL